MRATAIRSLSLMAEEGIRALGACPARASPPIPTIATARSDALYGAWLCGVVPRPGRHGAASQALPHARRHLRPAACRDAHRSCCRMRWPTTPPAAPEAMAADGARARRGRCRRRASSISPRRSARRRRCATSACPRAASTSAADLAVANPYWNPRPLERGAIRELIARAWAGEPPVATKAAA